MMTTAVWYERDGELVWVFERRGNSTRLDSTWGASGSGSCSDVCKRLYKSVRSCAPSNTAAAACWKELCASYNQIQFMKIWLCHRRQLEWNNANPTAWPRVSDLTKRCLIACPINANPNHVCFLSANVLIQRLIFCALRKQSPAYIRSTEKIAFLPGWVTPIKKREGKKKDSQSQKRVIFLFTQSR